MRIYQSRSSGLVKVITVGTFLVLLVVALVLIFVEKRLLNISGALLLGFILASIFYFWSQSIKEIMLSDTELILKKNIGRISISINEIERVVSLEYADIPMTIGSRGVFGFIGRTMDDSRSYVKDRKEMVQIVTSRRKYLISCEDSKDLVKRVHENLIENSLLG